MKVDVGVGVQIEIENLSPVGGLSQTPYWVCFARWSLPNRHSWSGSERFRRLELIAEEGDTSELSSRFRATSQGIDTTIAAPGGFFGSTYI